MTKLNFDKFYFTDIGNNAIHLYNIASNYKNTILWQLRKK